HCVHVDSDDAGRAEVALIAGLLDVSPKDDCHVERQFGPIRYRAFYNLRANQERYEADLALLKSLKSSAGATSPSVAGAEVGAAPAVPMADCTAPATQRIRARRPESDT